MGKPCPKHATEFKRRAVQPCNERGTACAEVARGIGADPSSLADWVGRASAAAPGAEAVPFQMAGDLRRLRRGNERLKRESEVPLKASAFLAGRQLWAPGRRGRGSLSSCSAPGVTGQGCCARRSRGPSGRDLRDAGLAGGISGACEASRRIHGAPKVFAGLRRRGERTPRERAARIMRENGRAGAARGCAKRPEGGAEQAAPRADSAPGLARRGFSADGPSGARFAGIACVRAHRGRPCLAAAMSIRSGKIVGWPMSARMAAGLADDAPGTAIAGRRPPGGRIRHGDRGSRHASLPIGRTMREAGIGPSMGSIASPWDDAAMESPMGLVKAGCVHARTFETRDQAALEMFDHIGCSCNRVRIRSAPGNLSPEGFEAGHAREAASAA